MNRMEDAAWTTGSANLRYVYMKPDDHTQVVQTERLFTAMSPGDSLWPDRTPGQQQDVAGPSIDATPTRTPTEALFARTDANLDAEFAGIFGPGGPEARAALEQAAATEGPAAGCGTTCLHLASGPRRIRRTSMAARMSLPAAVRCLT